MSDKEEIKNELEEESTLDASQDDQESKLDQEPVQDEDEVKARQHGWDPAKGSKTAKEYNLIGELIELKKTVQKRDKDLEDILKYHENTIEQQKANYRKQLDAAIKEAKLNGDADNIEALTQRKADYTHQEAADKATRMQQQLNAAIADFTSRNADWYNPENPELVQKAVNIENRILNSPSKPATYEEVLRQIEVEMRRKPDIEEPSRPTISSSKSNINKSSEETLDRSEDALYKKLDASEQAMYRTVSRSLKKEGIPYTVKEFIQKSRNDQEFE